VALYKLYETGAPSGRRRVKVAACTSDAQAMEYGRSPQTDRSVDVWQSERLLGRVE